MQAICWINSRQLFHSLFFKYYVVKISRLRLLRRPAVVQDRAAFSDWFRKGRDVSFRTCTVGDKAGCMKWNELVIRSEGSV